VTSPRFIECDIITSQKTLMETLESIFLLKNFVLEHVGVGDLHALEACSPLLTHMARVERHRKNKLALVIYSDFNFTLYYSRVNVMKISRGMQGMRFAA
jgi:hypothetical protein